jgi:hypothetical protein
MGKYLAPPRRGTARVGREVFDTLLYGHFMPHKENTTPPVNKIILGGPNIWEHKFRWSSMCLIPKRLARPAGSSFTGNDRGFGAGGFEPPIENQCEAGPRKIVLELAYRNADRAY